MTADPLLQYAAQRFASGDLPDAVAAAAQALAARPGDPNALRLMGVIHLRGGHPTAALDYLTRAATVDPDAPHSHGTLASALAACGRMDDALRSAERAVALDADYVDGHVVRGIVLTRLGRVSAATDALRRAVALRPSDAAPLDLLGQALATGGENESAIEAFRRAVASAPSNAVVHDNLLLALNHHAGDNPQLLHREHLAWAARHADPLTPPRPERPAGGPGVPLRVGYLSPDFRTHAVSRFFEPLLAGHDRSVVHVTLYANVEIEDAVSERLRRSADGWVNVIGLNDEALSARIREDLIDVLIDLAGHTAGNRLPAMARRPAPLQGSYLGYPNTTGMRAVDFVITDADLDPPALGAERWHTERLLRLPRTIHCFRPPDDAPDVAPAPPAGAPVRFGSFNRLEKLTPRTLDLWSGVLHAVPRSTLTIKSPALADSAVRDALIERFAQSGIAPDRLILLGRDASAVDHLQRYGELDVALDSYPYNGTTTTCEALWMGVPVVTLEGPTRLSRTTGGILRAIGLAELCAEDKAGFVSIAARLAADAPGRGALRAGMRERMRSSALMDAHSLASAVEAAILGAWQSRD